MSCVDAIQSCKKSALYGSCLNVHFVADVPELTNFETEAEQ